MRNAEVISQFGRLLLSLPGLLLGAKLLGALGYALYSLSVGRPLSWLDLLQSGIAYYGGLFGLLAVFLLLGRTQKFKNADSPDCLAATIPLFHFFGRLGCFFSGCCFGCEHTGFFSVLYTTAVSGAPVTAARFPVQLVEAGCNLILFIVLLCLLLKKQKGLIWVYLPCYAILRFILEFFRGDQIRGMIGCFSTSQTVSLFVLIVCIFKLHKKGLFKHGEVF